ncbi:signal peptidase I [Chryseomicrobium palamuruense]|uniref:Signal peptidase I n=1 Tax=Chryseomicrobium palamuruense TaxID=682973 RepID=A0ABV8UXT9_9BACL
MTSIRFETTNKSVESKSLKNEIWSSIRFFGILILLFLFLKFGFSISTISGYSMVPTFDDGSLVITNNLIYEPEHGDIVIYTDSNGFNVIKRVIGLPGDQILISNGVVYLNNVALEENYTFGSASDMSLQTLPADSYFLIGDHRTPGESFDSRSPEVGSIHREDIKGEMLLALNPFILGSGR